MARKLAAIAVFIAASPVIFFSARTMVATWLVPPIAYLAPTTPTTDLALLARAQELAPGEAFLPYFEAQAHRERMQSEWIQSTAPGHGTRAASAAERATSLAPASPYFHLLAGAIDLERARLPEALESQRKALIDTGVASLRRAVERSPGSPLVARSAGIAMLQGFVYLDDAQRRQTLALLRRAAAGDIANLGMSLNLLRTAVPPGELVAAATQITPDTGSGRVTLAAFLFDAARALADGAVGNPAADADADIGLTADLFTAGLEEYVEAAEMLDLDLSVLTRAVVAARQAPDAAQQALRARLVELTATNENAPEAWFALALMEATLNNDAGHRLAIDRAMERMATASTQTQVAVRRGSAAAWQRSGALEAALSDLEAAQELAPRDPQIRIDTGRVLDQLDRPDEALEQFEGAVSVAPSSPFARQSLGDAYLARFEYLDAIEQWQAIVARDAEAVGPRLQIARAYTSLGLLEQAMRQYTEILELRPEYAVARREMEALTRRLRDADR